MATVTNELIYDVLKDVQRRLSNVEEGQRDLREQMIAFRTTMIAMQSDLHNLYVGQEAIRGRLDRIERRLDLIDTAAE
jgi:hypothetical protein